MPEADQRDEVDAVTVAWAAGWLLADRVSELLDAGTISYEEGSQVIDAAAQMVLGVHAFPDEVIGSGLILFQDMISKPGKYNTAWKTEGLQEFKQLLRESKPNLAAILRWTEETDGSVGPVHDDSGRASTAQSGSLDTGGSDLSSCI